MRNKKLDPALIARWSEASESLGLLRPEEQDRVLSDSALGPNEAKLGTGSLGTAELAKRFQLAYLKANVAGLQKSLDRRMVEAYLGGPVAKLDESHLLEKAADTSFKALSMRTKSLLRDNAKLIQSRPGSQDVQLVGVGEGVRPGGLGLVPGGTPVALGTGAGGVRCLRPVEAGDWKLDPATNRIHRAWDPKGFRDVGMLLWRVRRTGAPGFEPTKICSFVRVGSGHAVTAAHCVLDSPAGAPVRKRDFKQATIQAIALIPRLDGSEESPADCFDKPDSCGYFVSRFREEAKLPDGLVWSKGQAVPNPDVALLQITFGASAPVPQTVVTSKPSGGEGLTLAGYGLTNAADAFERGSLLVGWQQNSPQLERTSLVWSVDVDNGAAGGCGGDSGGAVYEGDISGSREEGRSLLALISSGDVPRIATTEVQKCVASKRGRAARLDVHRDWLCSTSRGEANGCGGKVTMLN